jgi:aryl-alcohol dehydrogenase-like predicted oxidoreductase
MEVIALCHSATISQVALAWMLADPVITSPIIGATSIEQLNENLGVLQVKLDEDEITLLNKLTEWRVDEE